ncbi:hypothetical protein BDB01DRAFT_722562 [Pilobolus umbonatus]|nr:hypothetical protein BDB01DRAFT_722562 [Pilobolus umbonatus]
MVNIQNVPTSFTAAEMNTTAICDTLVCINAATSIKHDLNMNIDPCEDFFQYTCGGWIADSVIPPSESGVGVFNNLRNDNLDYLQTVMESTYEDLLSGISSDVMSFVGSEREQDAANFNKLKSYYNACMNEDAINSLGPTPIYAEVAKLYTNLEYDPDNYDTVIDSINIRNLTSTFIHLKSEGIKSFISFSVGADDRNPDENSIVLNQPPLGLPSREYYGQSDAIDQYRQGLINIVSAIFSTQSSTSVLDTLRNKKMAEYNLKPMQDAEIEDMVARYIKFETHLANITLARDNIQNPIDMYNPMSLPELYMRYPVINWVPFFRHLILNDASIPKNVIVSVPEYMANLTNWLTKSKNTDNEVTFNSIREFLVIRVILHNIDNLDQNTRELYRSMIGHISSGTTAPRSRSRVCLSLTSDTFGQLLGRYFVMRLFGGEKERMQVSQFLENIRGSWSDILPELEWLDQETKERAVEKVKKIKHKEAYSVVSPDVRSPSSLHAYYAAIEVNEQNFYFNQQSANKWETTREWYRVGQAVNKNEWFMDPHEVNAYYSPNYNEIVIPAGILQNPFYHSQLPEYLNYGGIGVVIGHEITHAFDNSGRLFDGDGRLNTWWSNATSIAFDNKTQCFINQYSQFSIEGTNNTRYNVNGKMTLGENLADNGGLHAAMKSMRASLMEKPDDNLHLPGLDNFSPEQLFFINFARVWCGNMRPEMAVQRIRADVHSPAKARVNGVVQNSIDFANAFQCQTNQPMNPVNKCQIW